MTFVGLVVLGLVAGALAASLGIGGGVIFVPALVVLFAFDQHIAQGTSLAVILPTAVVGTITHARAGRIDWRLVAVLAVTGFVGGLVGSQSALAIDETILQRMFAVLLVLIAVRMIVTGRRRGAAQVAPPPE